jgi:hypothetical protein
MPYSLVIEFKDGTKTELKPLAFDNPKSEFGFEDNKIKRKAEIFVKKLKKEPDVLDSYCVHYQ